MFVIGPNIAFVGYVVEVGGTFVEHVPQIIRNQAWLALLGEPDVLE